MTTDADTDRALLEAAARAAGISVYDWLPGRAGFAHGDSITNRWNPLLDDGDALRLAVRLDIDVCRLGDFARANYCVGCGLFSVDEDDDQHGDPCAATRRAIVRAAAAMDKEPQC